MINYLVEAGLSDLVIFLALFIGGIVITSVCVFLDFVYAKRKYKADGILKTHSWGLRQSLIKFGEYSSVQLLCAFIDIVNPLWFFLGMPAIPIFIIGSIGFAIFTEFLSIREKTSDKFRKSLEDNPERILRIILEQKENVKKILDK